jgi:hypothetical protein
MAEVLKIFQEGEDILASETNANNNYLLGKISDNASTLQNYVEGEVTSIQSSLASAQATLQNNINEMSDKLNAELGSMYENIAPNMNASISISSGWTATSSGWIYAYRNGDGFTASLKVDGKDLLIDGSHGSYSNLISGSMLYIGKDSTVTFERYTCTFYPCKGVQDA